MFVSECFPCVYEPAQNMPDMIMSINADNTESTLTGIDHNLIPTWHYLKCIKQ